MSEFEGSSGSVNSIPSATILEPDLPRCSLKARARLFLRPPETLEIPRDLFDRREAGEISKREFAEILQWHDAGAFLLRLEALRDTCQDRWGDFIASLSLQQRTSWSMITDWLRGFYHPAHLGEAARKAILQGLPGPRVEGSPDSISEFPASAIPQASVYHYQMCTLFAFEFLYPVQCNNEPGMLDVLEYTRRTACEVAISQSIAHANYVHLTKTIEIGPGNLQGASDAPDLLFDSEPLMGNLPWIDDSSTSSSYPHYLWSTKESRTVSTKNLPDPKPPYTCVSHTWGRWRQKTNTRIPGVVWDVPDNSIFAVCQIPELLAGLQKRTTDYVWFDLVCIPQTREGELGRIARQEIARQADIFRNAAVCVV